MSGKYPHDNDSQVEGDTTKLLKQCFGIASELMFVYEPFGQAASSYESGAPEYTALGIRTFLSIPANIQMMEEIGKNTLESLKTLACVEEFRLAHIEKFGKPPNKGDHMSEQWLFIKKELKQTDKRTYDIVMSSAQEYVDEIITKYEKENQKNESKSIFMLECKKNDRPIFHKPFNSLESAKSHAMKNSKDAGEVWSGTEEWHNIEDVWSIEDGIYVYIIIKEEVE